MAVSAVLDRKSHVVRERRRNAGAAGRDRPSFPGRNSAAELNNMFLVSNA
ncbi:hypothetical protein [Falsiroseomonas stagni]|nr:hypothetical protein [Falsiroseomonas stagni]